MSCQKADVAICTTPTIVRTHMSCPCCAGERGAGHALCVSCVGGTGVGRRSPACRRLTHCAVPAPRRAARAEQADFLTSTASPRFTNSMLQFNTP